MLEESILKIDEKKLLKQKKADQKNNKEEIVTPEEPYPYQDDSGEF